MVWKDTHINIIDTPGHADFGGEVERILNMVDGVVVLVDASEGPLPQTKFVVSKALKRGMRPIVVINKIDRPDERHLDVLNEIFDLFANLDASDEQLDFPVLYGSGRNGWMALDPAGPQEDLGPMFDLIVSHVPPPTVEPGPTRILATTLEADSFLGRILTGRITSGTRQAQPAAQGARPRRQGGRELPRLEGAGLPRPRARAGRRSAGGRDRGACRHERGDRRRYAVRSFGRGADRGAAGRSADAVDDVPHQRRAVRRTGRRQGAEPRHSRPAA